MNGFDQLVNQHQDLLDGNQLAHVHHPLPFQLCVLGLLIHRVGKLEPTDQIVLVAVTSAHRGEAFAACQFVMDYLKTRAPFWKKERTPQGERWVEARASDDAAATRWQEPTDATHHTT